MTKFRIAFVLLFPVFFANSCVEGYDAETETMEQVLVVEGLVTNELKYHYIKLSRTTPYSQAYSFVPERDALIYITDDLQNIYYFTEHSPGVYRSNTEFSGAIGRTYKLHLETLQGDVFQSSPQTIMPTISVDTLYGRVINKQKLLPDNDGELILTDIEGVEVITDVVNYDNNSPRFRFDPIVLVQYITVVEPSNPNSPLDFCRLRVSVEDMINLTVPQTNAGIANTIQHDLAFVPLERKYYRGLYIQHTRLDRRALIVRQFSLNDEAYIYYKQLSEQLQSEGSIFDPMEVQLYGNITCVNDPDKLVLGFFEASGYYSETFVFASEPIMPHRAYLRKVHDLDHLPKIECFLDIRPALWLY